MVGQPLQRQTTDPNFKLNHIDKPSWQVELHAHYISTRQQVGRHLIRPPHKTPEEPNFSQRTENSIIYSAIFVNICQDNNFIMTAQLGDKIRALRTKQNLLLRQVASKLEVDTSIISKMERGKRPIKKEQIAILADILKADKEELQTLFG